MASGITVRNKMAEDAPNDPNREKAAFKALFVAALRQDDCDEEIPPDVGAEVNAALNDDDRRALDALGDDLVDRILAGEAVAPLVGKRSESPKIGHLVAMNRGGDLTDQARKEMEQRIQDAKGKGAGGTGS
ncbi:MAG: hypothetical protein JWN70_5689 [Planctomycetaceae bacterium]|nr:hypothetical protein [Planctomycetaceae bacterium]